MEGKNLAQADRSTQPVNPKRALRSTTAAQALTASNKNSNTAKPDIKVLSQAIRTHLEKEGLLKRDEPVTAMSAYEVFKKIFEKIKSKCQPEAHTTLISFMMILGELAVQKDQSKGGEAEKLVKQISTQIDSAVEKGLQKLSGLIDVSLANHADIQNSTKKLGEAAGNNIQSDRGRQQESCRGVRHIKQAHQHGELVQRHAAHGAKATDSGNDSGTQAWCNSRPQNLKRYRKESEASTNGYLQQGGREPKPGVADDSSLRQA